jgi:hypothetical protein
LIWGDVGFSAASSSEFSMASERRAFMESISRKDPIEYVVSDTILMNIDGVWTFFYKGRKYIAMLDARSRDDALAQIAEMMFMKIGHEKVSCFMNDRMPALSH